MLSIDTMQQHNHKIAEYSKILSVLIQDKELCHTDIVCDLFFNYVNAVNEHFTQEETNMYQPMLIHSDSAIKNTATHFMSGSMEIKRVIAEYKKKWCSKGTLRIRNHPHFIEDTEEIFAFVDSRIMDESHRLYPAFRKAIRPQQAA